MEDGGINLAGLGPLGDIDDPFKGRGQGGKFRALADCGQGLHLVRRVHHVPAACGQHRGDGLVIKAFRQEEVLQPGLEKVQHLQGRFLHGAADLVL